MHTGRTVMERKTAKPETELTVGDELDDGELRRPAQLGHEVSDRQMRVTHSAYARRAWFGCLHFFPCLGRVGLRCAF